MPNGRLTVWREAHWDAYLAHQAVAREVRAGRLKAGACEVCGHESAVGHHDDYAQRLTVRWLCAQHHKLWHLEHHIPESYAPPRVAPPVAERPKIRGRRFRQYLVPRAKKLREEGFSHRFIAEALGVSTSTVHDWVSNY